MTVLSIFERLYSDSDALRVNINFDNGSSYITATSGAASYPEDADNFDDLFSVIDKMLYLGKSRGRNCYSIYDYDKHKDIEITKLANHGIYKSMSKIRDVLENAEGLTKKLQAATPFLTEVLQVSDMYYVDTDGNMRAVNDKTFKAEAADIDKIMDGDVFSESTLNQVKLNSPVFYSVLKDNGFESVLITKIRKQDRIMGYLVCAAKRSFRIWQETERAIMYYLAGLLAE